MVQVLGFLPCLVGDLDGIPVSLLKPDLTLAVADVWRVNQQMEISVTLPLG